MSALSIPYELRIGVTGHRNLPDAEAVERAVDRVIAHLRGVLDQAAEFPFGECGSHQGWGKRFDRVLLCLAKLVWPGLPLNVVHVPPDKRTPVRWVVVSPLAKGADQIVARAVLKQPQDEGRPKLQMVSPFSLQDYRRDFAEPADRAEFENLLSLDPNPTILPYDYGLSQSGDTPEQFVAEQELRNKGYYAVGKRVVDACEILIVIWNGEPAAGHGGTAEIVQYAVEQGRTIVWIDSNHPERQARIIVGLAPKRIDQHEGVVQGLLHRPLPQQASRFSRVFHRLAAYNRDPAFDHTACQAIFDNKSKDLSEAATNAALPADALAPVLATLMPHFARADQLANRYQQLSVHAAAWLQRLSSIAVSVVVAQVLFFPTQLWLIIFEILAMLIAVGLLRISRREAWHEKWLRDRHLAERLRSALFTTLAKPSGNSASRPDETLPFYQSPDDWIVETYERLTAAARDKHTAAIELASLKKFLVDAWIGDQANYHAGNAKRKEHAAHIAHRLGTAFFCTTMLMALLHLLGVGHGKDGEHHDSANVSQLITALAIILPAWGATIHSINALLERDRIAQRSGQMAKVLTQLVRRIEQASTPQELSAVISQAEELMLLENHEWWVSLSFRSPILPA